MHLVKISSGQVALLEFQYSLLGEAFLCVGAEWSNPNTVTLLALDENPPVPYLVHMYYRQSYVPAGLTPEGVCIFVYP